MCILCILIPILVGLICALLGYFLGRQIEKKSEVYTKLRADLGRCRTENEQLQTSNNSLKNEIANMSKKSTSAKHDFDGDMAASVFGESFKAHNPTSWPLQSEMAYTGKWDELKKWQDDMLGGKL